MKTITEMIKDNWKKYKSIWISIFILFIVTRLILSIIAFVSLHYIPILPTQYWKSELVDAHPILSTWAVWDSDWYLRIAKEGYQENQKFDPKVYSKIGFFPLYPLLVSIVTVFTRDFLVSGLIISNLFLILSAFLLYLLIKEDNDEETARRGIWYLFLFPSAYIFSAVYPESLLLFLWIASVLSAKRDKWLLAGILGFLATTTKPIGIIIFIPLTIIYFEQIGFSWKKINLKKLNSKVLSLILIPIGLLTVSYIDYIATGDMFSYSHVQQGAWGHAWSNPFWTIYNHIVYYTFDWAFNAWILSLFLIIILFGFKKLPFGYWLFTLCALIFIPSNGLIIGCLRYFASFFPIIILLAMWGKRESVDRVIVSSSAILQGFLFVFWIMGYWFVS